MDAKMATETIDWLEWTEKAMKISGSFEGNGEDWGNPVGNFDGAYLTCGLLGFTWKWNNQPPMIEELVKRKGKPEIMKLMPKCGASYLDAAGKGEKDGAPIVSAWSVGEHVDEPYKSELSKLWSSPEMKKIQTETARTMFGQFAKRKTLEGQQYYGLAEPRFSHYAYWFDQAILNGTGKTPTFEAAETVDVETVFDWMSSETGWTQKSFNKNRDYWRGIVGSADDVQRKMWILAYLRSSVASENGDTVTMCRRGSLALGSGWINDSLRTFDFTNSIKGNSLIFLELAQSVNQGIPAKRLVEYKLKSSPNGDPRYWATVDFNQPSTEKRFYLFDTKEKKVIRYYVAHGRGSEGAKDDGLADVFSNVPNSNASSLGIYECLEVYEGKHGTSLRLEGLEATNSHVFDRSIVLHGADYVSDAFIKKYTRIGRSEGCFAVEMAASPILANELKNGSFIIAWKNPD